MLEILKTLISGANAQAQGHLESKYSIELINQKIRESEAELNAAKSTLVTLIQRQRIEQKQCDTVKNRKQSLEVRAKDALMLGREDLAAEAAKGIADLENELSVRQETASRVSGRIERLRTSLDTMARRLVDLKQGEIAARAYRNEADAQRGLNKVLGGSNSFADAEVLIGKVLDETDPFEQAEILEKINSDLTTGGIESRLEAAGIGDSGKVTASEVLARLKSN
ncbi:hypothetical protein GCM10007939_21270 [Amylibacter marinus]|uniref:Phage shock protein A (PspA) family protein n=1 Tax=Amylibacter marinus TaxID=1475483 RepID=A0ABQ5VWM0_9RHOB|nr:PspA/IM30 family protein [Amylibacter marinus]GLQ35843.1 hypothetical protein GCM10007939_21270 [Amylibacter marinus]